MPAEEPVRTGSLRRRVVVAVLTLLLAVLITLGLTVNYLLHSSLRADLRQRLIDRAGYAVVLQQQGVGEQELADRMSGQGVLAVLNSGTGQFVGRPDSLPAGPTGFGPNRPGGLPKPSRTPRTSFAEHDGQLTATVTLPRGTLTLSTGEGAIARTMQVLRRSELIAGAVMLLLTALMLSLLVRAALRPLERITALAWRIRDGARGRRLRPTRPGTELGRTAVAFDGMLDALESAESQAWAAQRAAQNAEQAMRRFLGDASHDLRTPLAGVIASAEQLLREPAAREVRERRLVELVRQAQRASRLVDDLLTITRLDAGELGGATPLLRQDTVDLVQVALVQAQQLRLRHPELTVVVPSVPANSASRTVGGDVEQLHRIVANLLDNAAAGCLARQLTPSTSGASAGTVSVSVQQRGSHVILVVGDDGIGVPPAQCERIFDRFVRLNEARTGIGTGLGLPIARGMARAHGGELVCRPAEHGASFELRLPAAAPDPLTHPEPLLATSRG